MSYITASRDKENLICSVNVSRLDVGWVNWYNGTDGL